MFPNKGATSSPTIRCLVPTLLIAVLTALFVSGCSVFRALNRVDPVDARQYEFTYFFEEDTEDWTAGYAELPVAQETAYALQTVWAPLPVAGTGNGIRVTAANQEDNLFLFIKHQVSGLTPNMTYEVQFRADVLSNATVDSGAGAATVPGSSVVIKAGASEVEPIALAADDGYYYMNIDIGTPAAGGDGLVALGNLSLGPEAIPEPESDYGMQTLQNDETPFTVKADANGSAWLIFGAEVGTPGQIAFYYSQIGARFTEAPPSEQ